MKLAFKLIFALVFAVVALLIVEAYVSVERERVQFEEDMARELAVLGGALSVLVEDRWQEGGSNRALELLEHVDRTDSAISVRFVWLDSRAGAPEPLATSEQLEPVRSGQSINLTLVDAPGARSMVAYAPIRVNGAWLGALELRETMSAAEAHDRKALARAAWLTLLVALIGGGLIATLGVRWVGRPLQSLIDKTRHVAAGDLTTKVALHTGDELEVLGNELDAMSGALARAHESLEEEANARVRAVEQLRHADRLTTVGTLAAGVAHELGTPLTIIAGHASLLLRADSSAEDVRDSATTVKDETVRMTAIIQRLLAFARRTPAKIERVELGPQLHHTVELLQPLVRKHGGSVTVDEVESSLWVCADPTQLQQVLSNLIINGLQSRAGGASVHLTAWATDASPPPGWDIAQDPTSNHVRIDVRDDGEGISHATMNRMFEPFFTTKDVGEGTGLGLSIAHGLVAEMQGWIVVESEQGAGSCLSVYLPQGTEP